MIVHSCLQNCWLVHQMYFIVPKGRVPWQFYMEVILMLEEVPSSLKVRKKYLMQIISAKSEFRDCGSYGKYRFDFGIRVWPNKDNLKNFCDVREIFYDNGRCLKYLKNFVEVATDCEFLDYETDVGFTIGAAFIGTITIKSKLDQWGNVDRTFYNLEALEALGIYELEDVND